MNHWQKTLVLFAVLAFSVLLLLGAKGPASIPVTYNNIKIVVDGAPLKMTVEPFIMKDGTIGVSVTDIAKALDKPVFFDTKSATLYVGRKPAGTWSYISDMQPLNWNGTVKLNPGEKGEPFAIAGKAYIKGVSIHASVSKEVYFVEFNLGGQYTSLKGVVGVDDQYRGTELAVDCFIYLDDELIFSEQGIKPGDFPREINLDVTNGIRLRLRAVANRHYADIDFADLVVTQ